MMKTMKKMPILSRKTIGRRIVSLLVAVLSAGLYVQAPVAATPKGNLATITGAVIDNKGNPVAGAVISLLRDGASKVIKQTRSDAAGRFIARISPGRYGIRAIAAGFNEVVFASIEVRASQELVYRFNLEPVGSGNTLPERRKDRDDVKWTLRSAQTRRSIFQVQEGEDAEIQAILGRETASQTETPANGDVPSDGSSAEVSSPQSQRRVQGVVETYLAGNSFGPAYPGLNFAIATFPNDRLELIFAGQTTAGPNGPERFEASTHVRAGDRHRVEMSLGAVRYL
ncbi:MAG: carboxypeptidase-like regulatory domain-containing protein, partial [Pyrinomonadaceae bacterium]